MPLTNEQQAYIAGIIDGEGSISLVQSFAKRTRGRYVYPLLRIANTNHLLLEWLYAVVGYGNRHYTHLQGRNFKVVHHIGWASNEAIKLLREVFPYLVIKRGQAQIILELWEFNQKVVEEHGGYWGNGHPIPREVLGKRLEALDKIHELNKRGVA